MIAAILASVAIVATAVISPSPPTTMHNRMREAAQRWLQDRGRLTHLPLYDQKGGLAALAPKLEATCGAEPGSMLKVSKQEVLIEPKPGKKDEYLCLFYALQAVSPEPVGMKVMLVVQDAH